VDADELPGVELGFDARQGFADQVYMLADVQPQVVARGFNPVDLLAT
jgi:hypothetical protein